MQLTGSSKSIVFSSVAKKEFIFVLWMQNRPFQLTPRYYLHVDWDRLSDTQVSFLIEVKKVKNNLRCGSTLPSRYSTAQALALGSIWRMQATTSSTTTATEMWWWALSNRKGDFFIRVAFSDHVHCQLLHQLLLWICDLHLPRLHGQDTGQDNWHSGRSGYCQPVVAENDSKFSLGPGLVFEVYPQAVATLPGSQFWWVPLI